MNCFTSFSKNSITIQVNFKLNNFQKIIKLTIFAILLNCPIKNLICLVTLFFSKNFYQEWKQIENRRKTAFLPFLVLMSTIILTQKIEVDIVGLDVLLLWFSE